MRQPTVRSEASVESGLEKSEDGDEDGRNCGVSLSEWESKSLVVGGWNRRRLPIDSMMNEGGNGQERKVSEEAPV